MATCINLSPSFLYHPYIPSFKSKDYSFACSCCRNCMYIGLHVRQLSLLQLFILKRDPLRLLVVVHNLVTLMLCCW